MDNTFIGFKVLSMKINYLSSFKHKHKHQTLVMKISYLTSLNRVEVMKFSKFIFMENCMTPIPGNEGMSGC
jgi:hypothetical protein